jgi:hypothetical protein
MGLFLRPGSLIVPIDGLRKGRAKVFGRKVWREEMNKNLADARHLGIHLDSRREKELFKWFLASLLFGKPIQTEIAVRAYQELVKAHLTGPGEIRRAGWDRLVALLDQAHYVRYDFSTATKLLEVCAELQQKQAPVP